MVHKYKCFYENKESAIMVNNQNSYIDGAETRNYLYDA